MLAEHSGRWLMRWFTYSAVEPFGEKRADYRAAMITATLRNAFRGEDDDPVTVEDCMPQFLTPTEREEQEREKAIRDTEKIRKMFSKGS